MEAYRVTEDHKPVAGCRVTYPEDGIGKIGRVCVTRAFQKSGAGSVLIKEAEKWIAETGITHIRYMCLIWSPLMRSREHIW